MRAYKIRPVGLPTGRIAVLKSDFYGNVRDYSCSFFLRTMTQVPRPTRATTPVIM